MVKFSVYLNRLVFVMKYFFGVTFKTDYFDFFLWGGGSGGGASINIFGILSVL